MKKLFLILGIFAAMLTAMTSCQDDTVAPGSQTSGKKAESVKNALRAMSNSQALERLGFGSSSVLNSQAGLSAGRTKSGARKLTTARTTGDSTIIDGEVEWSTCATETFVENTDGSYTWTLDYGEDGCEDDGYLMKGKLVETFVEDGNKFSGTIEYFNFGDQYFSQNGKETFSGTWEESGNEEDSIDWSYSGTYEYSENLEYKYKEDEVEETYAVVASGKQSYDENGFTVSEEDYTYTAANGDSFSGNVGKPLFYSYKCEGDSENDWIFAYVSGTENYKYKEGDENGEFSINYGDGACDNIVTITENGESYDIDLGKEWEDEWEDCTDCEEDGETAG
ncbi:hypothetical protein [Reichenbachiella sp.]|uniref:hypothetical protein n=1 Tax=Reichenbachiella sp. TaxID=2184521 RepID=UPI003299F465